MTSFLDQTETTRAEQRRSTARARRIGSARAGAADVVERRLARWARLDRAYERGVDPARRHTGDLARGADAAAWLSDAAARRRVARDRAIAVADLHEDLIHGHLGCADRLDGLAHEMLDLAVSRTARLGLAVPAIGNLVTGHGAHAYSTGLLACGIAVCLGWSSADATDAARAGLLADSGMVLLRTEIRATRGPLRDVAHNDVRRHPTYSVALSAPLGVPESILCAIHGHHERLDGTGYPRARSGPDLDDLARVLAVSDAFAGMIGARPYRDEPRPFDAIRNMLDLAERGELDLDAVRALVRLVGLFPTGSCVRLDDGRLATVERAGERPDRPLVRILRRTHAGALASEDALDLHERADRRIVQALHPLH